MLVLALWACNGEETTDTMTVPLVEEQGIVAMVRWFDDGRPVVVGNLVTGASTHADPDSSGGGYFFDLFPGRSSIYARIPDATLAASVPDVVPGALSAASMVVAPLPPPNLLDDPTVESVVSDEGVVLTLPAASLVLDGEAIVDPFEVTVLRPTEAQRALVPADQLGIRKDVDVAPVRILEAVEIQVRQGTEELTLGDGQTATLVFDLPADSPLFDAPATARFYGYSLGRGYWSHGGSVILDRDAGTGTVTLGSFGWIALGLDAPDRTCVAGRVVSPTGEAIAGVEVRSIQSGLLGVDRVTSAEDGRICLPFDDGESAEFSALGFDATRTTMYTAHGTLTGPLGDVRMDAWKDEDQDRAFDGPGGDCDDQDAEIGPSMGLADGSWCGSAL